MKRQSRPDVDRTVVARLLETAAMAGRTGPRIDLLSLKLIGCPYHPDPLIGSAQSRERFTARTDRFDCVTFIETILALARTTDADAFARTLRKIRYASGKVAWNLRNHYMTEWIRENTRAGFVRRVLALRGDVTKRRRLDVVPGLPPRVVTFSCMPKRRLLHLAAKIRTGDLVFFVSTRHNLDVFHCGAAVNNGSGLQLRHASRSRGGVVEQSLAEFLKQNRMAGVIVVRPTDI